MTNVFPSQNEATMVTDATGGETVTNSSSHATRCCAHHLTSSLKPGRFNGTQSNTTLTSTRTTTTTKTVSPEPMCDLFLAPSTIPGAGLGVFVGSAKRAGDVVGVGDVAIPIIDLYFQQGGSWYNYFSIFDEYQWLGALMGMASESDTFDGTTAFVPGIDAAVNCNFALLNVAKGSPEFYASLHRSRDPAAGAITPYSGAPTKATNDIPPGGELFKDYGSRWFISREQNLGKVPFVEDYERTDQLIQKWMGLNATNAMKDDLWTIIQQQPYENRRMELAMPQTSEKARQAANEGIRSIFRPDATRSINELKSNGRCIDVIEERPSTLPGAGRGAFLKYPAKRGETITGSPLLHAFRSLFHMYEPDWDDDRREWRVDPETSEHTGEQLIVNYCFGHGESTLLLCPYGAGVNLINHNRTQANIRVQFAPHGELSQNDEWLRMEPSDFEFDYSVSLAFDFVALRDIQPGEELFLDYGDGFEQAWLDHVSSWESTITDGGDGGGDLGNDENAAEYKPASVWNDEERFNTLRTEDEQEENPYPSNLELHCHTGLGSIEIWKDKYEALAYDNKLWASGDQTWPCRIMGRYWEGTNDIFGDNSEGMKGYDADTRKREEGYYLYRAEVDIHDNHQNYLRTKIWDRLPRGAFTFVDTKYSTDIHLPNAFRHEIHVPDNIWPAGWKDLDFD